VMTVFVMAIGLMLVLEGALPFISPAGWRRVFAQALALSDGQLRFFGLSAMMAGLVLVFISG